MRTFPKHNKLCGQLRIAALYKNGHRFTAWPLRVTYMPVEADTTEEGNRILVWAPKSLFKRAVKRNHMRRLMREAYRLHQDLLGEQCCWIAFNYMDQEEQPFSVIERAVIKALKKISNECIKPQS